MTESEPEFSKYFTVEEANRMLPLVRAIVGDIVELFSDVHERRQRLEKLRQMYGMKDKEGDPYAEEVQQMEDDLRRDVVKLEGYLGELRRLGIELKDPLMGLIDFPSKMDGRTVYLCWKHGEEEVGHWHELNAGYSGRQSLYCGIDEGR